MFLQLFSVSTDEYDLSLSKKVQHQFIPVFAV